MTRDREGHRDYRITHRVEVDPSFHGPHAALTLTPGLPIPGNVWEEGEADDEWAFFTREAEVVQVGRGEDNKYFDVTHIATTRPTVNCATEDRTDPLTFPDRVEVYTVNYTKEGVYNRTGGAITNSAFEQMRGPQVEYDAHRLQIVVEQNVASMELELIDSLMHTLNQNAIWGFDPRTVKLSSARVDPKYHVNCNKYFLRRLTFDVSRDFDKCLLDEGTKALRGKYDKVVGSPTYGQYVVADDEDGPFGKVDPTNPKNYIRYQDWNGNETRVILNGHGLPVDVGGTTGTADDTPGCIYVEYYPNGDFDQLALPVDLANP